MICRLGVDISAQPTPIREVVPEVLTKIGTVDPCRVAPNGRALYDTALNPDTLAPARDYLAWPRHHGRLCDACQTFAD